MNKYKALLEVESLKSEFVLDLFLCFSPEINKAVSKRNYNYDEAKRLEKGRSVVIKNEDGTWRTCSSRSEVLNITETELALLDKVEHIIQNRGGFKPALEMLKSFKRGVKAVGGKKDESTHNERYEYTNKNGNEKLSHKGNLPKAHFRWNNDRRYTLTDNQVDKIENLIKGL